MTDQPSLQELFRRLPAVDVVLDTEIARAAVARHGRRRVVGEVRAVLHEVRESLRSGSIDEQPPHDANAVAAAASGRLLEIARDALSDVVNATGVVVHTNLGRAPLSRESAEHAARRAQGGTDLEMDLATGRRGRRAPGVEIYLTALSGAPAAGVVNNGAAALMLAVNTFAVGRGVAVSRGELVEIGGSFRIPEICARAGARLVEVGTTNRTRPEDYARALESGAASLVLKVHPSNFRIVGFAQEVALADLARVARQHGVPLVMDQGSGALLDLTPWGVDGEPTVASCVADGADLVLFSGDKLLGGPQAGCMVGTEEAVDACRSNPMYRALRVGRMVSAALEATLWAHSGERLDDVPVLAQIRLPAEAVRARAAAVAEAVSAERPHVPLTIEEAHSTSGGGSSPTSRIPTFVLRLGVSDPDDLAASLRESRPAIIGRVQAGALLLDLRTVDPARDEDVVRALVAALS